jgi:hypothetical protein
VNMMSQSEHTAVLRQRLAVFEALAALFAVVRPAGVGAHVEVELKLGAESLTADDAHAFLRRHVALEVLLVAVHIRKVGVALNAPEILRLGEVGETLCDMP